LAEIETLNIDPELILTSEEANKPLRPFDHVFIRRKPGFEREQIVQIKGEVIYPGEFAISGANERISDVIKRAGGLNQFAYPKGASLIRRTIYFKGETDDQIREDLLREIKDNLDPLKNREGNEAEELLFERIEKKLELAEQEKLRAEREIEKGTLFTNLTLNSNSIDSTMRMNQQDFVGIDLEKILKNPGSAEDLILMEGDIIQIPKELQTVRMVGEVLLPTTTRFDLNRNLKNYISKAGGFTEKARRSKTYVVYANGDAKRTHSFLGLKFYPELEPGAEIIVPRKPEKEGLSAAGWIGLASSLATLGILVNNLIQ
jgi:protein involved in polysaccharide export with SLBB domain